MTDTSPILMWFRRDLRLSDHAALRTACESGRPVIPVFVHDRVIDELGAAPKWRLGLGVSALTERLERQGSRLILRRADQALDALQALLADTGAGAVYWSRLYDPQSVERDKNIKKTLSEAGVEARSFGGHLLFEPWSVATKTGGFYQVYTPFWNAVKTRPVETPLNAPGRIPAPAKWPVSNDLDSWHMGAAMNRGAAVVRPFVQLGEQAAQLRLARFTDELLADYKITRDLPGVDGTSNLSENLALGELSPRQCWRAGRRALEEGKRGAETFLKELVWREFAYHLMHHTPHILRRSWRKEWEVFAWRKEAESAEVMAWKQGRTGLPFVDAAMREMYVTGRMHNRGRMIVASYLTKHLMTHWRIGMQWFEECLIDWDPASNAMGWQWSAGSGPDAAPYFRVFNPETQLDKFDKDRSYSGRWIAEGNANPHPDAVAYFGAIPRAWGLSPTDTYPSLPVVSPADGRHRALQAYESRGF